MPANNNPVESLTEMFNRKARMASSSWYSDNTIGKTYLETALTYLWQPQTFCYHDLTYGTEVWRMTDTPNLDHYWQTDIGHAEWSADGKRMALCVTNQLSSYNAGTGSNSIYYVLHTNGSYFRPMAGSANPKGTGFVHWSPQIPDVIYDVGSGFYVVTLSNTIYKMTVSDTSIAYTALCTYNNVLPSGTSGAGANTFRKMISGDGRKGILRCAPTGNYEYFVPFTLWPDGSAAPLVSYVANSKTWNHYDTNRSYGAYGDFGAIDGSVPPTQGYHDWYFSGLGDYWWALPGADAAYDVAPTLTSLSVTSGGIGGGTSVTLTGTNFTRPDATGTPSNVVNVYFGDLPAASYSVTNATTITATSPAHTDAVVDVIVETYGGVTAISASSKFTYGSGTASGAAVSSLSPTSSGSHGGSTVTITGTGFTGATAVYFGGRAARSYTVNSATSISATTPYLPPGTCHVQVVDSGGIPCSNSASNNLTTIGQIHNVWFRQKTVGTGSDGGPVWSGDDGSHNFGEIWPENQATTLSGNTTEPWSNSNSEYTVGNNNITTYWSHFVPDRWGRFALHSCSVSSPPTGFGNAAAIWDYNNHQMQPTLGYSFGKQVAVHHDWHGFTDWCVTGATTIVISDSPGGSGAIWIQQYTDTTSVRNLVVSHSLYNGTSTIYTAEIRPGQSPDGTKIHYESTMLQLDDSHVDCYWCVAYYPYPPTTLDAVTTGVSGEAQIRWLPPIYTTRKWINSGTGLIDESGGETLYGREIQQYRIWRSTTNSGPWMPVGTQATTYANDATTNTLNPTVGGNPVSGSNKVVFTDAPGNGTWYYAVTSEEWSGLASRNLSDVIQVVVSGASVSSSVSVNGGPPLAQLVGNSSAGQTSFWATTPSAPSSLSYANNATGVNTLTWTEPSDPNNVIRYYNLYYSQSTNITATATFRFASIPKNNASPYTAKYVDWNAATSGSHYYGITAVDMYGNESALELTYSQAISKKHMRPRLELSVAMGS